MFNKLLVPGSLKAFIQSHPEFSWNPKDPRGMTITWAHGEVARDGQQNVWGGGGTKLC